MARRSRRKSTKPSFRGYKKPTYKKASARSKPSRGQTVRLVIQTAAPQAPVMLNPLGGTELVMPGAPRPKRARF